MLFFADKIIMAIKEITQNISHNLTCRYLPLLAPTIRYSPLLATPPSWVSKTIPTPSGAISTTQEPLSVHIGIENDTRHTKGDTHSSHGYRKRYPSIKEEHSLFLLAIKPISLVGTKNRTYLFLVLIFPV